MKYDWKFNLQAREEQKILPDKREKVWNRGKKSWIVDLTYHSLLRE